MQVSVTMPTLDESVTEGTVTQWLKSEGDTVALDEPLLEVSTDKVDTEIPSPAAGVLTEIVVGVDETVAVGAELMMMLLPLGGVQCMHGLTLYSPSKPAHLSGYLMKGRCQFQPSQSLTSQARDTRVNARPDNPRSARPPALHSNPPMPGSGANTWSKAPLIHTSGR